MLMSNCCDKWDLKKLSQWIKWNIYLLKIGKFLLIAMLQGINSFYSFFL